MTPAALRVRPSKRSLCAAITSPATVFTRSTKMRCSPAASDTNDSLPSSTAARVVSSIPVTAYQPVPPPGARESISVGSTERLRWLTKDHPAPPSRRAHGAPPRSVQRGVTAKPRASPRT